MHRLSRPQCQLPGRRAPLLSLQRRGPWIEPKFRIGPGGTERGRRGSGKPRASPLHGRRGRPNHPTPKKQWKFACRCLFARVVKGVDLRSTGGISAWVQFPLPPLSSKNSVSARDIPQNLCKRIPSFRGAFPVLRGWFLAVCVARTHGVFIGPVVVSLPFSLSPALCFLLFLPKNIRTIGIRSILIHAHDRTIGE